ncbi:MAG: GntR family transcriptional regulator [Chloroflexota bacterium]
MIGARTSLIPLYAQVKQALQQEIENRMKPGDALPSEPELEKRFGVSRITVRRALDELASDGLIMRQQGKGTFVREQPIAQELTRLLSWSVQMRQMGLEPASAGCEIDLVEPTKEYGALLELPPGAQVVRIRRLRLANNEPICIMTNYIPEALVPGLMAQGLIDDSLYATLATYGIKAVRAEDRVEARSASEWEAHMLQTGKWAPLLQVTRLTRDWANKPLYIAVVTNRADKYVYTVHFGSQSGMQGQ